ncbi:YlmH family RNA-binding protein [Bacillus sp. FJAT-45037]|uniref:YlmH family RNA-binding protein n=1 Tax=Bacillus sp. FJAT-45037 TaxID=2011007 RepID=UPI000C23DEF2|nr:RNA-binding protein [Bacillus sp. FJAT-45037]
MSIFQHYREEERPFVEQVVSWKEEVGLMHQVRRTDFLDPREQAIVKSIIGHDEDVIVQCFGGGPTTERKRAYICPPYLEIDPSKFDLTLFSIHFPAKFVTLTHSDVLGSLMNIGLVRHKFGDITVEQDTAQVIVASEIADFVEMNVTKIGKASVRMEPLPLSEYKSSPATWSDEAATISSLRIDTVLSEIYNLSRAKVRPYIEKGLVKVNWRICDQVDFVVKEGDYISVRGYGRSKIDSLEGRTKKDKVRIRYGKLT